MTLSPHEKMEIGIAGLLGLVVFVLTFGLLGLLNERLTSSVLETTIAATAQLLAFGGVIFAIFYPVQRAALTDLRGEVAKWEGTLRLYPGTAELRTQWAEQLPAKYQAVTPYKRAVELTIADLQSKISQVIKNYAIGIAGLVAALAIWAFDLVLELVHLALFHSVSYRSGAPLIGYFLIAFEFSFVTVGLCSFVISLSRGVRLALLD